MLFLLMMADAYLGGEKSAHSFIIFFEFWDLTQFSYKWSYEEAAGDM